MNIILVNYVLASVLAAILLPIITAFMFLRKSVDYGRLNKPIAVE